MIDPNDFDNEPVASQVTGFKCPRCTETRPSRARLAAHLYNAHRRSDSDDRGYRDALNARVITDVSPGLDPQGVPAGLDAARMDIVAMGRTLADVAERMERLDMQTTHPEAVRRSVLEEVAQRLVDAGDAAGYSIVRAMIREGA